MTTISWSEIREAINQWQKCWNEEKIKLIQNFYLAKIFFKNENKIKTHFDTENWELITILLIQPELLKDVFQAEKLYINDTYLWKEIKRIRSGLAKYKRCFPPNSFKTQNCFVWPCLFMALFGRWPVWVKTTKSFTSFRAISLTVPKQEI